MNCTKTKDELLLSINNKVSSHEDSSYINPKNIAGGIAEGTAQSQSTWQEIARS